MLAGLLGIMLAAPTHADPGPPAILALTSPPKAPYGSLRLPTEADYRCHAGAGDCFRLVPADDGGFALQVFDMDAAARNEQPPLTLPSLREAGGYAAQPLLWDRVVKLRPAPGDEIGARSYLIGVIERDQRDYSGHSRGEREVLRLFRLSVLEHGYTLGPELLSVPWRTDIDQRRCFNDTDTRLRRGVCRDRVSLAASLALDPTNRSGILPALRYTTRASATPRTASPRLAGARMARAGSATWRDPVCSYVRTYRFDSRTGRYVAAPPIPTTCEGYARLP